MTTETSQEIQATDAQSILQGVGIQVQEKMTTPSKAGKQPRKVYTIVGNTAPYAHLIYDLTMKVKQFRGVLSCWEDPTEELAERIESEGALSFAERKQSESERAEARADRLEERARKHLSDAQSAYRVQKAIGDGIPLGQPVLCGHHSEARHRRDLAKIDNNVRKFVEKSQYSEHLADRAATSRERSEQNYSLEFLGNRVEDCKKELREIDRNLKGVVNPRDKGLIEEVPATGAYRDRLLREQAEVQEKLEYWEQKIEEKGGLKYSKDTVKVGDWVYLYPGGWHRVYKVNKKTVTTRYNSPTQKWSDLCEYYDIKAYCPREKAVEYGKQFDIDLDECNRTNLDLRKA